MSERAARARTIAAALGAVVAAGAAALYVARALHRRARETSTHRGPSAGRPLRLVRGGAGEA